MDAFSVPRPHRGRNLKFANAGRDLAEVLVGVCRVCIPIEIAWFPGITCFGSRLLELDETCLELTDEQGEAGTKAKGIEKTRAPSYCAIFTLFLVFLIDANQSTVMAIAWIGACRE